jgi:hypothetical protein
MLAVTTRGPAMTESTWLRLQHPAPLVKFVATRASERKLRLYLCAGCRSLWNLLYDPVSQKAVETAERYADGEASLRELWGANYWAECPTFGCDFNGMWRQYPGPDTEPGTVPERIHRLVELGVLAADGLGALNEVIDSSLCARVSSAAEYVYCSSCSRLRLHRFHYRGMQPPDWPGRWLVDCVFGNPFRPVTADPVWLTSDVVALARGVYAERAFDRLPILADAIQDAGCDDANILTHCRGPGPHVRGCWVVDLVLGKS